MLPPRGAESDQATRELAAEILARGEYARWHAGPGVLTRLRERVEDWLAEASSLLPEWLVDAWAMVRTWFAETFGLSFAEEVSPERWILGVLLCAAIAAALVLLARALLAARAPHRRDLGGTASGGRPTGLLDEARQLADVGRYLEAAHCAQLATVELLLERRWLVLERSEPNRTLRRRLNESALPAPERAEFGALLSRLEGRWFRDRVEDRDLFDAWTALHRRLAASPASPAGAGRA